jgi:aspartyl-tRNA(Asn)/glutamyl-tRNA(Gln) amidotransferase subunit A
LSANLARFDGIKYGFSKEKDLEIKTLLEVYLKTRQEGFGEEVRRRIMLGTYSLSAGYYDAYYLKAQKVRTLIRQDFKRAFEDVDLIVSPTSPTFPFKIGEKTEDPVLMYLSDVFTISANLAGLPAVSLPVSKPGSLPTGLQIMGKPMEDYGVLSAAAEFEEIWKK